MLLSHLDNIYAARKWNLEEHIIKKYHKTENQHVGFKA
jgi:hypothetical protein